MARLRNPWPDGYTINARSPYGYRIHPITGKRTFHHGVDVGGTFPVTVAADGVVSKIGWSPKGGGHTVLIDHGDIVTVYYHGREKTRLTRGQSVKAGDLIYTSGSTGASTGPHLHFEVRRPGGRWGDTLDPVQFLPKPGTGVIESPVASVQAAPKPPVFQRPISADHMSRLAQKFGNFGRRGWFGG